MEEFIIMKKHLIGVFWSLAMVAISFIILQPLNTANIYASNTSNANYQGTVIITNNNTLSYNLSVPVSINSTSLINNNIINGNYSNVALLNDTTNDAAFMPAYPGNTTWIFAMPQSSVGTQSYTLYAGNTTPMNGKIRYFPGTGGMTTTDSATLEPAANFSIEQKGYINTDSGASKYLVDKAGAITVDAGITTAGKVTAIIPTTNLTKESNTTHNTAQTFYSSNWYSQTFAANTTYQIGGVVLRLAKAGSPAGTFNVSIRATSADLPTGPDLVTGSISPSAVTVEADYVIPFSTVMTINSGTVYAIVFSLPSGDASNYFQFRYNNSSVYAGGRECSSSNSGSSWTGQTFDVYFKTLANLMVDATVANGEHTIKVYADGTNFKMDIDGVNQASTALSGVSVTDNSNNWTMTTNNSMQWVEYQKITVSGVLKQNIDAPTSIKAHEQLTFTDQSGNGQSATPTFRTTTSVTGVIGVLASFNAIHDAVSRNTTYTVYGSVVNQIPGQPGGNMYSENTITAPGHNIIDELATASNIPVSLPWFIISTLVIMGASIGIFALSKSLALKAATVWMLSMFFALFGIFAWWVIVPLGFICGAGVLAGKVYGY